MSAELRVERGQAETMNEAVKAVIGDCLRQNDDIGRQPTGAFLDWNWRRVDAFKAARAERMPKGVPGSVLQRRWLEKQIEPV